MWSIAVFWFYVLVKVVILQYMDSGDIRCSRLHTQQIIDSSFEKPADVIRWFGAMQAQDFAAAKWAIGLRTKNQTDESIERAFNEGLILRTHIMRPTWHFVAPQDIRWLLGLTSPQVQKFNGYYYRKSGLDKSIFEKSNKVIRNVLQGNRQLTRSELDVYLREAHIPTQDLGLSFTLMQAELEGILCSGPPRGKQFTYMLLDERVKESKNLSREESLATLTKKYFQSHGPAQVKDFMWWSGLSAIDVKQGLELLGSKIQKENVEGKDYWFFDTKKMNNIPEKGFLIPGFDEYFIAYTDRSAVLDSQYAKQLNQGGGMVSGAVVIGGKMLGGWRRSFVGKEIHVAIRLFEEITKEQRLALGQEAKRYGEFMQMPVHVTVQG
jgi:hypothetical protein